MVGAHFSRRAVVSDPWETEKPILLASLFIPWTPHPPHILYGEDSTSHGVRYNNTTINKKANKRYHIRGEHVSSCVTLWIASFVSDGLVAFAVDRWHHDSGAGWVRFFCTTRATNEGREIRFGYLPFRTQVFYRPRQNDRLRVMFGTSLYRYHIATHLSKHKSTIKKLASSSELPYIHEAPAKDEALGQDPVGPCLETSLSITPLKCQFT
ncbi:hypothetical protein TNCV_2081991 [Trichonephila clavipes]|nr:hypothetical protein TNCV_2081991 [Trichonephila clavipes]